MRKILFTITIIVISLFMIAGCNTTETVSPPTATPLPPTPTPLPPTATPTAAPTSTPTSTPTATEVPGISDPEFAEKAQDTCNALLGELKEISNTDPNDPAYTKLLSEAYSKAAEALGKLNFTAESAPLGYQLQTNLALYAKVLEEYKSTYEQALAEAGISGSEFLTAIGTDYTIHVVEKNSDVGWITLNIDKELAKHFYTSKDAFLDAASELNLKGCAPTESDLNN